MIERTCPPAAAAATWLVHTCAILALAAHAAAAAPPTRVEGVEFEPTVKVGSTLLNLKGAALLRYRVVFRAYVAALYLAPGTNPADVLSDVPKRLEIEYFWGIGAADFAEAMLDRIALNLPRAEFARLEPRITEFNRLYVDVSPGDRYSLTYEPGVGTELALNGTPLGTSTGPEFAQAAFSIWLGKEPLDIALKTALLGR